MGVTVKLDPDSAAKSLALRVAQIEQAKQYIRETYARYEGLKPLEKTLADLGVADQIHAIVKE